MLKTFTLVLALLAAVLLPGGCGDCLVETDEALGAQEAGDSHAAVVATAADDRDDDDDDDDDSEQVIPLDQVPVAVLEAARAAVPGAVLTSAEVEREGGQLVYSIEGTHEGEAVEIEVSADGQILEIEHGDDD